MQTLRFPLKITEVLLLKTETRELFFAEIPQRCFLSKLGRYFPFMGLFSKNCGDSCSALLKNIILRMATIPTEMIGYKQIP